MAMVVAGSRARRDPAAQILTDPGASLTDSSTSSSQTSQPSSLFTTTSSASLPICDGCYGVAAIDEFILGLSLNGAQSTSISATTRLGDFTWIWTNSISINTAEGAPQNAVLPTDTFINYNGTEIFLPTLFNVFKSFRIVTQFSNGSTCTSSFSTNVLTTPISIAIPTSALADWVFQAETLFVAHLPQLTCSNDGHGGIVISSSIVAPTTIPTAMPSTPMDSSSTTRIAIGVSISIVGAIICATLILFLQRLRARKLNKAVETNPRAELATESSHRIGELYSGRFAWQAELGNDTSAQELPVERQTDLE